MNRLKTYDSRALESIPHLSQIGSERLHEIRVVSAVLPFRINSYVLDELIRWEDPACPIQRLTIPARDMLSDVQFASIENALADDEPSALYDCVQKIRASLNPHPAGQMEYNRPELQAGRVLEGVQHKYSDTLLFFPQGGQTCHSYCTFCFRWPQFVGQTGERFVSKETDSLAQYLQRHPEVRDVLFTGGDPMTMRARLLRRYLDPLMTDSLSHIQTIRFGSKALSYWPYRFLTDPDAGELLSLFEAIIRAGKQLSFMAHFSHPRELETEAAQQAIRRIQATGAVIRTQSPVMRGINDSAQIWTEMLGKQLMLGCVPYYMFVARETGAHPYFAVPLERCLTIFQETVRAASGLAGTLRGPVLSTTQGKIQILDRQQINGRSWFVCQWLRARDPALARQVFIHPADPAMTWMEINPFADDTPVDALSFHSRVDPQYESPAML